MRIQNEEPSDCQDDQGLFTVKNENNHAHSLAQQTEYHIFDPDTSGEDMTVRRLMVLSRKTQDRHEKKAIQNLLEEYRNKNVAIAWMSGRPLYINITKE